MMAGRVSKGARMNWNGWIRQGHRWLSIIFTAAVVANLAALALKAQTVWVGLLALLPLILLLASGLYLFALPYLSGRRSSEREG
jgi:hypothetical protein